MAYFGLNWGNFLWINAKARYQIEGQDQLQRLAGDL